MRIGMTVGGDVVARPGTPAEFVAGAARASAESAFGRCNGTHAPLAGS